MTTFMFGLYQIFKKPWTFVVTTAMLTIGLIVSFYSLIIYDYYHYPTKQVENVLKYDMEDVYKVNFGFTIIGLHENDVDNMFNFIDSLGDIEGVEAWGGYEAEMQGDTNTLYMCPSLIEMCGLENAEGKPLCFDYSEVENAGIAFVGSNLSGMYPVGSIYYDEIKECEYIVADVIKPGSKWLPARLFGDSNMELDDTIILDFDYAVRQPGNQMYVVNISNTILVAGNTDNLEEQIQAAVQKSGLDIDGVVSFEKMYSAYEKQSMSNAGENYLLPLILVLSAVITSVIASKMAMLSNMKDYGIMISNGFTKNNIIGITLTENAIKCFCAFCICILYWRLQYLKMDEFTRALYEDIWPVRYGSIIIIYVLMSQFPIRYLSGKKPYELVNQKEL